MTYQMTTINNGTRIRQGHSVYDPVITSVNSNVIVTGDELWTAPANGNEVFAGDKWLRVKTVGGIAFSGEGWMALTHKGVAICKDFKDISDTPPPPVSGFPEYFILTDPDGKQARYNLA